MGLQFQSFLIAGYCLGPLALLLQGVAQVIVNRYPIGAKCDRELVCCLCFW